MSKNIFIVNPVSGNGKSLKFIDNLEMFAKEERKQDEIKIIETNGNGHASTIASTYSNNFKDSIIYSVGGDGTLNEVINGMNPKTKMSIIPSGSGNDFYRIFKEIEGTKTINLGIVNGRKFINIASLGIDAKMANRANEIKLSNFKALSYPRAIIEEILKYESFQFKVNGCNHECSILTFCNGKYYGSGIPMNIDYDLNDGFLNIITAGKLTRKEILVLLIKILKGSHLMDNRVTFMKGDKIIVESSEPTLCSVDGEIIHDTKFEFGIIEEGLTVTNDIPQYVKKAIKTIK